MHAPGHESPTHLHTCTLGTLHVHLLVSEGNVLEETTLSRTTLQSERQQKEGACLLVVLPDARAQALGQAALGHPLVDGLHAAAVARDALALLVQVLQFVHRPAS